MEQCQKLKSASLLLYLLDLLHNLFFPFFPRQKNHFIFIAFSSDVEKFQFPPKMKELFSATPCFCSHIILALERSRTFFSIERSRSQIPSSSLAPQLNPTTFLSPQTRKKRDFFPLQWSRSLLCYTNIQYENEAMGKESSIQF